jgi:hypothetical protein
VEQIVALDLLLFLLSHTSTQHTLHKKIRITRGGSDGVNGNGILVLIALIRICINVSSKG